MLKESAVNKVTLEIIATANKTDKKDAIPVINENLNNPFINNKLLVNTNNKLKTIKKFSLIIFLLFLKEQSLTPRIILEISKQEYIINY